MTHVQTEVSEEEYERLRTLAEERGLSIRDALREATELWIEKRDAVDPDDPLFDSVEAVREASDRDRESTVLTTEGDLVEEWTGDAEASRLAEPE
jgi:hypothetical protein